MAIIQEGLSAYHLSDAHRAWQPAKGNFFELEITDLDGLLLPGLEESSTRADKYITNAKEVLRLTVKSFKVPHFSVEDISITKGNTKVHYAGAPTFEDGSLVIDDMIGAKSKAVLEAWQNLTYNVLTDKGGRATDYKKNCTITEYTSDHVKVREWILYGCWPKDISEDDYDKTNDDLREVSATIVYDRAVPIIA